MITIDLDRASTVHLIRTYLMAKRMFPNTPIEVYVSGRGVGYHIKLYIKKRVMKWIDEYLNHPEKREQFLKNLEDIFIRALLWDDPVRLSYALKKWALNPDEKYVDLCFNEKMGGKETKIDLEQLLGEDFKKMMDLYSQNRIEELEKLVLEKSKEVEKKLKKYKKTIWIGCIAFNGDDLLEKIEKVCMDISTKDRTFKWKTYPCFFPEFDWMLVVESSDKDKAWKRIVWLKNKTALKNAETRLWVKERKAT